MAIENIPQQLRLYPHWVCYRLIDKGEPKLAKVPYDPKTGRPAKANDSKTWGTYQQALDAAKNGKYDGIGFEFSDHDPFTGIDLDHCVQDGVILPWAQKIIDQLNSYSEYSPSITGVHAIVEAVKPGPLCKKDHIEIYDHVHFFTVTGKPLPNTSTIIEKRQGELDKFYADVFGKPAASKPDSEPTTTLGLSDDQLIDKAIKAEDGAKFEALWNGDISSYGKDDSAADMALCCLLAYWTQKDHDRIDSLFRRSGLMREKWDRRTGEQTYGDITIDKAIKKVTKTYQEKRGKQAGNKPAPIVIAPIELDDITPPHDEVEPFPIDALPDCLKDLITQGVKANQCPPDFIALFVLVALGSAIGNKKSIQIKSGWEIKANMYVGLIAKAGTGKTHAQKIATRPIRDLQRQMARKYEVEKEEYEKKIAQWEVDCVEAKKCKVPKNPKPEEPFMDEVYTSDTTVEALAQSLERNPQGITIILDELTTWVNGLNQYKGGKGTDREYYLSFWSGVTTKINRKGKPPIIIDNPFLSVMGSIPPSVLGTLVDEKGNGEDGFIHRILFLYPDPVPAKWTEGVISHEVLTQYHNLILKLRHLPEDQQIITLDSKAYAFWVECYNEIQTEKNEPDFPENLHGPWSKLDTQLAKIALIIYCVRLVSGETDSEKIDGKSIGMAYLIIKYFKSHARRVYSQLAESEEFKQFRQVLEWKKKHKKTEVTGRELVTARLCKNVEEVMLLFNNMQKYALGEVKERQGRGRKTKFFAFSKV